MVIRKLGALAAISACIASTAAAQPILVKPAAVSVRLSGQAAEAARTVDAFHAALNRGDGSVAASLLDDQVVIYEEGEAEQSKAAYASSHLPADIAFLATAKETLVDRTGGVSGGLAWIASRGHLRAKVQDTVVERETTETMVLRRTTAGWRIVHVHWSSAKSGPAA